MVEGEPDIKFFRVTMIVGVENFGPATCAADQIEVDGQLVDWDETEMKLVKA